MNFDHVSLAQRDCITSLICCLPDERWPEVQRALMVACGSATENDIVDTEKAGEELDFRVDLDLHSL
jgi:hypothetical protein